jgi:hypothetical protein
LLLESFEMRPAVPEGGDIWIEAQRSELRQQQSKLALASAHGERREQKEDSGQPTASS